MLATVLFTDIVELDATRAQMGDEKWRKLLDEHDRVAGQMVENHRGKLVKNTGDGILRRSTDQAVQSNARCRSVRLHSSSVYRYAQVSTPARSK